MTTLLKGEAWTQLRLLSPEYTFPPMAFVILPVAMGYTQHLRGVAPGEPETMASAPQWGRKWP